MAALHAASITVPRPWTAAEFAVLLAAPGVFLLDEVDGLAVGRLVADEAELLTLAVRPDARRRGTGRRLLAAFEARAARGGAGRAFLEVAEDNGAARALYAGAGYGEVGRRPGYYGGADALVLAKGLG